MNTKYLFIFLITLLFVFEIDAQDTNFKKPTIKDSLQQLIANHHQEDEEKVRLLNEYARQCFYDTDPENGFTAAREARELSEKLHFEGGKIMYYLTLASYYGNRNIMFDYYRILAKELANSKGDVLGKYYIELNVPNTNIETDFELLLVKYSSILQQFEELDHKEIQANILMGIGFCHYNLENFKDANKTNERAIKIFTEIDQKFPVFLLSIYKMYRLNELGREEEAKEIEVDLALKILRSSNDNFIGFASLQLAAYYNSNNRYNFAIEYYLRSADIFEKFGEKEILYGIYSATGGMYGNVNNELKAYEQYKKAEELHKETSKPLNSLYAMYGNIAYTLIHIQKYDEALKYMELSIERLNSQNSDVLQARYYDAKGQILLAQENYKEAIPVLIKSLDYFNRADATGDMWIKPNIAKCYFKLNDLKKATEFALSGYEIAELRNHLYLKINTSLLLSEIYAQNNQIEQAFKFLKIHQKLKAESDMKDNAKKLADFQIQSILNKSNNEIEKLEREKTEKIQESKNQKLLIFSISGALLSALLIALLLYRNNKNKQKTNQTLESTLTNLKSTQSQLIQSEKMASLGELTAGIAHEIQNPLNFVNNFSEVSTELLDELKEELKNGNNEEVNEIIRDVVQNLEKILHHGKRAEAIVKGMLQHSRGNSGQKTPTDINALADEFLRLSYHGLRAKDKSFNADFKLNAEKTLPMVNVVSQDIGRVLLNLINNAFYAVDKKAKSPLTPQGGTEENNFEYKPEVIISTTKLNSGFEIRVKDNGSGISSEIKDKIFQPFFTTKPTGDGTGLGLSLSYDIINAHGGTILVETKENKGTEFILTIPV